MLVKIVKKANKETTLHEADSFKILPDKDQTIITWRRGTHENEVLIRAGMATVYIMGADGKTMDTFRP